MNNVITSGGILIKLSKNSGMGGEYRYIILTEELDKLVVASYSKTYNNIQHDPVVYDIGRIEKTSTGNLLIYLPYEFYQYVPVFSIVENVFYYICDNMVYENRESGGDMVYRKHDY